MSNRYDALSEVELLALCVWREARGESEAAQLGVAWTIKNRAHHPCWWGHNVREAVLKPFQFSSFNENDPNSKKFPHPGSADEAKFLKIAEDVLAGVVPDPTFGATRYYDQSLDGKQPAWAFDSSMERCMVIGRLRFYRQKPAIGGHDVVAKDQAEAVNG